ncbi:MAG: hypothetical protein KZQ93_15785 [Candidatus Thiodiazotropha sp. (ex Monitilora ramsayi)]|nr:hypothetical protein [Candidatus Thiodiazotropha sp. (ex Monitilora ramsayi)]
MLDVIIGGVHIPLLASVELNQEYNTLTATTEYRMGDGSFESQTAWAGNRKLKTIITGRGQIPVGLLSLNLPQKNLTISCTKRRAITSDSNVIVLPANRRSDAGAEPIGFVLNDAGWQSVNVTFNGDEATLDVVAWAKQYQVEYYPEFLANVKAPIERKERRGSAYSWSIEAEEM